MPILHNSYLVNKLSKELRLTVCSAFVLVICAGRLKLNI